MATNEAFLMEALASVPVVDSHTHLPPEGSRLLPSDLMSEYTGQYVGHDMISAGMPQAAYASLSDLAIPLIDRYRLARPYLDAMRNTGYGQCLDRTVRGLLCADGLSEDTLDACNEAYLKSRHVGYYDEFIGPVCGITRTVIDHTGMQWPYVSQGFMQAYNIVHMLTPYSQGIFDDIAAFAGVPIRGFDSYLAACEGVILRKVREQNLRVLKCPIAYQRPLAFPSVTREEAEREFNDAFDRRISYRAAVSPGFAFHLCPAFQSYTLHHLLAASEREGLVMQLHTGYLAGNAGNLPQSNPMQLIPLLFRYPGLRFDLFHMGYPYYLELAAMAKTYPNAYVNMCWGHILSPNTAVVALLEYLDTVPATKIIGFGSDTRIVDTVYGHIHMARENIVRALAMRVEQGKADLDEALRLGRMLLHENAEKLYCGAANTPL